MTYAAKTPKQHRILLDDIYRDFEDGLLSVKGCLFYVIRALCPPGRPVQLNVSEFLERTGIHRGSYARAVAALISEGRLDYPPNAIQTLRVPVLEGTHEPAYYSLTASRSQICDRTQQICDRTQQICDRSEQICDNQPPKSATEAASEPSSIYLSTLSLSLSEGEREEDAIDPDYKEWLTKQASQLPTPPTLIEEWIQKNYIKKSNRKQFLKYKQALKEAVVPQPAAPAIFEVESEAERRLGLLQFWWEDGAQERVKATIAAHPEWRLRAGEFGPELMEAEL